MRVAVLDDWQRVALRSADWSVLQGRAEVTFHDDAAADADALAARLDGVDMVVAMRERSAFPRALIARLPALKLLSFTGRAVSNIDLEACRDRGIVVCNTGGERSGASTAELALGLLIAAARSLAAGDRAVRAGAFQSPVHAGLVLEGRRLGIVGPGRIGARVARYAQALGMETVGWSPNLTPERAAAAGVAPVDKDTLFATCDAVSVHLVLSERTRRIVSQADIARLKPGAIFVNTARSGLVDEHALVARLVAGTLCAGLDVYEHEPLPANHPLCALPNVVLAPHIGYCAEEVYTQFYRESVENCLAFLDGRPVRQVA
jgi:phosphoglycerate dehydrogenase-like enzyme